MITGLVPVLLPRQLPLGADDLRDPGTCNRPARQPGRARRRTGPIGGIRFLRYDLIPRFVAAVRPITAVGGCVPRPGHATALPVPIPTGSEQGLGEARGLVVPSAKPPTEPRTPSAEGAATPCPYGRGTTRLRAGSQDDARAVRGRREGRAGHNRCSFRPSVVTEAQSETRWQATLCPVPECGLPDCSRGGGCRAGPFVPRAPVRQDGPVDGDVDGAVAVRAGSVLWRLDVAASTADVVSGPEPSGAGVRA